MEQPNRRKLEISKSTPKTLVFLMIKQKGLELGT